MFISQVKISGFGKLRGTYQFVPGRCNVICQENEYGKSTLVDAILYALYRPGASHTVHPGARNRERYRPWTALAPGLAPEYGMQLLLRDVNGRDYELTCDFALHEPYRILDLSTGEQMAVPNSGFGRQMLRMPLHVFTQCCFLRQDEHDTGDADAMLDLIEQSTASQPMRQSPIQASTERLQACRIVAEGFAQGGLAPANMVQAVTRRLEDTRSTLAALEREHAEMAGSVSQMDAHEREDKQLASEENELEYWLTMAELRELEATMESLRARARRYPVAVQPTEADERHSQERRARLEAAYAQWQELSQQVAKVRGELDEGVVARLRIVQSASEEGGNADAGARLSRLQQIRTRLREIAPEIPEEDMDLPAPSSQSDPPAPSRVTPFDEHGDALRERRRRILEFESTRTRLEESLANARARHLAAVDVMTAARTTRQRMRGNATVAYVAAILMIAAGAVCFIAHSVWPAGTLVGSLVVAVAALAALVGLHFSGRAQKHSATELQPAMDQELKTSGEARRLAEELENLRAEYREEVEQVSPPHAEPRPAAPPAAVVRTPVDMHAQEREALLAEARGLAPDGDIEAEIDRLERRSRAEAEREQIDREGEKLMAQLQLVESGLLECEIELEEILGSGACDSNLGVKVAAFIAECDAHEPSPGMPLEEDESAVPPELVSRREHLRERITQRWADADPPPASFTRIQLEQAHAACRKRRHDVREQLDAISHACRSASDKWRTGRLRLRAEVARLELLLDESQRASAAIAIAQQAMQHAGKQAMTQWATALNERVNELLPVLNPSYSDAEFTDTLEVSLHSHEVGRRLSPAEVRTLSKGARDQVGLAIRVAISEYLSAHVGNLPIVLDEPFAHWDDTRFMEGVRLLAALAERHQVILLSCHGWRFEHLRRTAPALHDSLVFAALRTATEPAPTIDAS